VTIRDAIDEIVDWQLGKKYGTAVTRYMVDVIDDEERIIYKSARWEPKRGWLPGDEYDDTPEVPDQ